MPAHQRVDVERPVTVQDLLRHTSGLTYGVVGTNKVKQSYVDMKVMDPNQTNEQMVGSPAGERLRERTPTKRWAEPAEIAGAAIFLASPAAAYVNGHTLIVDGGVSATYLA